MQQQRSYNSSEAARLFGLNNTTVQRAIQRGDLLATRYRDRSPFSIDRAELLRWGATQNYKIQGPDGQQIDPATGEVVEAVEETGAPEFTPVQETVTVSREVNGATEYLIPEPRPRVVPNVSRVLLPSADAGLLEAARRLVAISEKPTPALWQALRAILAVEAPA